MGAITVAPATQLSIGSMTDRAELAMPTSSSTYPQVALAQR